MNIYVITGPSGIGKTHLIGELVTRGIQSLPVFTDREKRPTENGFTDRVYLTPNEFTETLPEFIYDFSFQGNRYGYKKVEIEKAKEANQSFVCNIPLSHLPGLLKVVPDIRIIFLDIDDEGFEMLKQRMIRRDIAETDSEEIKNEKITTIDRRIAFYKEEQQLLNANEFSFLNDPNHKRFVITDDNTLFDAVIPYIMQLSRFDTPHPDGEGLF